MHFQLLVTCDGRTTDYYFKAEKEMLDFIGKLGFFNEPVILKITSFIFN